MKQDEKKSIKATKYEMKNEDSEEPKRLKKRSLDFLRGTIDTSFDTVYPEYKLYLNTMFTIDQINRVNCKEQADILIQQILDYELDLITWDEVRNTIRDHVPELVYSNAIPGNDKEFQYQWTSLELEDSLRLREGNSDKRFCKNMVLKKIAFRKRVRHALYTKHEHQKCIYDVVDRFNIYDRVTLATVQLKNVLSHKAMANVMQKHMKINHIKDEALKTAMVAACNFYFPIHKHLYGVREYREKL